MEILLTNPYSYLDKFLLILVRTLSLFIALPFLNSRNIPTIVKVGLAFFMSIIIINVVNPNITVSSSSTIQYIGTVIIEMFVGWLIGFTAYLAFSILTLAGQFIDYQIGFSMTNVFDPLSQIQFTITGNLYYYLVLLIAIITNAHHYFIKALIKSYELIPIGQIELTNDLYNNFIGFFNDFFIVALQIAAPFFLVMLLSNVILGILARTAPQMNLFVIGFPLKILLGLLVLYFTMSIFDSVSDIIVNKSLQYMDKAIKGMMP